MVDKIVKMKKTLNKLMPKCVARRPMIETEIYLKYGFAVMEHETHRCPKCGNILNAGPNYYPRYCSQCGQKVDFMGIKWKEDRELRFEERSLRL